MPIPLDPATVASAFVRQEPVTVQVDQRLFVRAKRQVASLSKSQLRFESEVEATYGVSKVHADTMTIEMDGGEFKRAHASGRVRFTDPEGSFTGDSFTFDWTTSRGDAKNVFLELEGMEVRAESIMVQPNRWVATNARIEACDGPLKAGFTIRSLEFDPGSSVIVRDLGIRSGSRTLLKLPRYRASLVKDDRAFPFPQLTYGQGRGFGLKSDWNRTMGENTSVSAQFLASANRHPETSLVFTRSFLASGDKGAVIRPQDEVRDPIRNGFFENVGMESIASERDIVGSRRMNVSLATSWNADFPDSDGDRLSKPFEAVFEASGPAAGWAAFGQARLQRIDTRFQANETRGMLWGILVGPSLRLGATTDAYLRIDARSFLGRNGSGWLRAQLGVVSQISPRVRLGVSYANAELSGTPGYTFDELRHPKSVNGRFDLDLGPTQVGLLLKFDPDTWERFDREIRISQVIGCFEPFFIWREDPNSVAFGIVFRPLQRLEERAKKVQGRTPGNNILPN